MRRADHDLYNLVADHDLDNLLIMRPIHTFFPFRDVAEEPWYIMQQNMYARDVSQDIPPPKCIIYILQLTRNQEIEGFKDKV